MSSKSAKAVEPAAPAPSTALSPIERAAIALNSKEEEKKLIELAKASASITVITNQAGYDQCHSSRMALKRARINIETLAKEARDDANKFSKGCIAEERRLIAITQTEEDRLERIQTAWDDIKRREKEAKEAAERQRVAAIQARIEEIRQYPLDAVDTDSAGIEGLIKTVVEIVVDDTFAELKQQADGAKATTLIRLRAAHTKALAFEVEQKRLADERARLELEEVRQAEERKRIAEDEARAKALREADERRLAGIRERIQSIRAYPDGASLKPAAAVQEMLDSAKAMAIDETFAELREEAQTVLDDVIRTLANVHYERKTHEQEQARLAAERARIADEERVAKAARDAEAAKQAAENARIRRENVAAAEANAKRIAQENAALLARQEAQLTEDRRLFAERQEAERIEAERQALREAEQRQITEARAQLERDQEALRVAQERAAVPVTPEVSTEAAPATTAIEPSVDPEPEPLLASIDFKELLAMQTVCRYAKEWASFQDPDSKEDQKSDRKLAARAQEAAINLLVAVEALA